MRGEGTGRGEMASQPSGRFGDTRSYSAFLDVGARWERSGGKRLLLKVYFPASYVRVGRPYRQCGVAWCTPPKAHYVAPCHIFFFRVVHLLCEVDRGSGEYGGRRGARMRHFSDL